MKKLLQLKKITFLFMVALLFSGPISAQTKLIFICDTNARQWLPHMTERNEAALAEQITIDIFLEDGYDVEIFHTNDGDAALSTYPEETIDMLDEADLIYIGRHVPSLSFDTPDKELWNALFPPIMTENMWALRSSRMNWFNSTAISEVYGVDTASVKYAQLENLDDPVFDDLEEMFEDLDLFDTVGFWVGPHCLMDVSANGIGNGIVMAYDVGLVFPLWVRFEDGDEFYPGSVDIPEGERVYFGLGCDPSDQMQYYTRHTEVSREMFLREAARLSGHDRGETGVKEINYGAVASKVYFNPVTQNLVVEMDNLNKVEVLDITGKQVYTAFAKSNKLFVDLGFAENGIYLVRLIDNNNKIATNKIIK